MPVAATEEVPSDSGIILKDLNLTIPAGKLTAIIGSVGSGKTSLLNAMLGEMKTVSGKVRRNGTVGYVPQTAWIYNGRLRDNILFGEVGRRIRTQSQHVQSAAGLKRRPHGPSAHLCVTVLTPGL